MLPLTRARRVQIAATGVLTVLALALVGWLLLRPAAPVAGAGSSPEAAAAGLTTSLEQTGASAAPTDAPTDAAPSAAPASLAPAPEPSVTLTATTPTSTTAGPEASVPGGAPVAFVGDGLDPAGAANDWSALAASALTGAGAPVARSVAAADGAGWASRSADGRTFADLLDQVTGDQTRVIVLLGSRNDLANPAAVGPGAQQAIRVAKAKAPQAQVVVVGPPALGDEGSAALTATRRALSAATAEAGVIYLDPAATGSELTSAATTTSDGSVRLTTTGQVELADQVLPVLQRLLVVPTAG
ncbi:SGNH/GDSL hydrolase family protein [Quadrisphaera setariae]|uniref:SGNH/GDSL hydrolase family protein n=1 Tax=Quadrisphaera setariae TaxID=2593304 RepID=A0A5C8ZG69_9ACTN|nr:SGNH/GDSL hydrolase family protein [Quadrisphaera setariae]TXR56279.1 SGNH/GDSL hydrolase family protein [Quadrisphaera setariae]